MGREIPERECERCGGSTEAISFMIVNGRREDGERICEASFIYQCLDGCLMKDQLDGSDIPFQFSVASAELTRQFCMTDEERAIGDLLDEQLS